MARRSLNFKMLDNVSMALSQTSPKTNVESVDEASIIVNWSGGATPVGTITIEASNSPESEFATGTETWEVLDFAQTIDVSGNSGSHQIQLNSLPFKFIRFNYIFTSGLGNLTAHINGNSIGA